MSPDTARNDSGKESATGRLAENSGPSTLVGPYCLHRDQGADQRSELNAARSSDENSSGSSQAAKWPPLSTSWK
jgi:hypothetical protein